MPGGALGFKYNTYSKSIIFQFFSYELALFGCQPQIITAETEFWGFIRPLSISFKLFAKHFL